MDSWFPFESDVQAIRYELVVLCVSIYIVSYRYYCTDFDLKSVHVHWTNCFIFTWLNHSHVVYSVLLHISHHYLYVKHVKPKTASATVLERVLSRPVGLTSWNWMTVKKNPKFCVKDVLLKFASKQTQLCQYIIQKHTFM